MPPSRLDRRRELGHRRMWRALSVGCRYTVYIKRGPLQQARHNQINVWYLWLMLNAEVSVLLNYEVKTCARWRGRIFSALCGRPSCQTLSHARATSRKIPERYSFCSYAVCTALKTPVYLLNCGIFVSKPELEVRYGLWSFSIQEPLLQ